MGKLVSAQFWLSATLQPLKNSAILFIEIVGQRVRSLVILLTLGLLGRWYQIKDSHIFESTLVIIKPDGFALGIRPFVYEIFQNKLNLTLMFERIYEKAPSKQLLSHYSEHVDKPYFSKLFRFMQSGPIVVSIWSGSEGTVESVRKVVGGTDPGQGDRSTIRGRFGKDVRRNAIHASDSTESAEREIEIWRT